MAKIKFKFWFAFCGIADRLSFKKAGCYNVKKYYATGFARAAGISVTVAVLSSSLHQWPQKVIRLNQPNYPQIGTTHSVC
jgi:hypothetical protein